MEDNKPFEEDYTDPTVHGPTAHRVFRVLQM